MKPSNIGGQAVMEGIMMRHKDKYSIAVRRPDKEIEVKVEDYKTAKSFLYHIGGNKMEYDRDKFKIMGKTEQNYIFSISLQEIKKILNENAN